MGFFRSDTMQLFKIVLPEVNSYQIIGSLGRLGKLHFIDQNNEKQSTLKPFSKLLKRCMDLEMLLLRIEDTMKNYQIEIKKCANLDAFFQSLDSEMISRPDAMENYILEISAKVRESQQKIEKLVQSEEEIRDQLQNLKTRLEMLKVVKKILPENFQ